jgi:hypothetical protein
LSLIEDIRLVLGYKRKEERKIILFDAAEAAAAIV